MRLITDSEVASLVNMRDAIAAVAAAFEQFGNGAGAIAPRIRAHAANGQGTSGIAMMGAALPAAGVVGAKVYSTIVPQRDAGGVAGRVNFVIVLFSALSGEPLAAIEANEITRFRTAAASAVAMRHLARRDARTLAVFGTGVQAHPHAEAFLLSHPFERVLVAGRAGAPEFANWVSTEFGVPAQAVDATRAASEAEVIVLCTRAGAPLFDGACVRAGSFVASIGANRPRMRELDDTLLARADLIAVEWLPAAQAEAGDFAEAGAGLIEEAIKQGRIVELGKLLVHGVRYVRRPSDIVIYKSVGIGLEDVALAHLVWQRVS